MNCWLFMVNTPYSVINFSYKTGKFILVFSFTELVESSFIVKSGATTKNCKLEKVAVTIRLCPNPNHNLLTYTN